MVVKTGRNKEERVEQRKRGGILTKEPVVHFALAHVQAERRPAKVPTLFACTSIVFPVSAKSGAGPYSQSECDRSIYLRSQDYGIRVRFFE